MITRSWRELTTAQASVLVALIATVPAIVTGVISYNSSAKPMPEELDPLGKVERRLVAQLPERVGFKKHVFPSLGLGMIVPAAWTVEDNAARFAGGEFDLVKRYEETKGIVGIKFRYKGVQKNYINDANAEANNQRAVWEKIDPETSDIDATINGKLGKLWKYKQKTGKRVGEISWYWIRVIPEVKLEIICFIYTDSSDREEFLYETKSIIDSLVIDDEFIEQGRKRLYSKS